MNQLQDEFYLKETFRLAKKGLGWTNPNPMVGAVIVKNGKIIGKGYHKKVGLPHAEIEAINLSKTNLKDAIMFTNLEPCCHFGKTPPCTSAIIKAGITKVVCSTLDPNQKVAGQGVIKLKKAGIEVLTGILEDEARILNEAFFTFHLKKRPFIALKFASSLDGKLASKEGDSKWITNEKSRQFVRKLRSKYQAVCVGIKTVLKDDPHLGVRIKGKKDPVRIILDPSLQIPLNAKALRDKNVIIMTNDQASFEKRKELEDKGFKVIVESSEIKLQKILTILKSMEIISILVEGGGETLGKFIDEKLIDKVYAFHAPVLIGGKDAVSIGGDGVKFLKDAIKLDKLSFRKIGMDMLTIGYPP